ncbi:MAG TPA: YhjD/YihY/BrkB family envelope integrity protein, partial [Candidatus Omnitrophota bacterium]|nr:YhjD/YihY/BrkB family envelope integrity protein [Candidatus Omnitrophota bacterium]
MIKKALSFIQSDIWRIRSATLPKRKSFLLKQLRIVLLGVRNFDQDKCNLRASALTYYSLLSIVPILAVAFGIAKGFGLEKMLEKVIIERLPGQEEIVSNMIGFSNALLENTKGGLVAGVGVAVLLWTVIKVLGNIEKSFNDIWGIKKMRSMGRRFADYLSIMFICPVLLILASGTTVFVGTQARMLLSKLSFLGAFSGLILFSLEFLPYVVMWVVFTFIYIFMPNTKVRFSSGLLGGIVSGTVYQIVQWIYVYFQVGVGKYNAIYGSFAAIPLFLIWLQMSWRIILFGAEISFAHQNVDTYEFEQESMSASYSFKKLLSLRIVHLLVKNFKQGNNPITAAKISHALEIPIRLVRQITYELGEAGIITVIKEEDEKGGAFQPARDTDVLTIKYVLDSLEHTGTEDIPVSETEDLKKIKKAL